MKNTSVLQWKLFARTCCTSSLSPTPIDDANSQRHAPFLLAVRYTPSLSTVPQFSGLEPPKASVAAWAVGSHELRFMRVTCLWRTQGEKRAAFCPFCKGKMPTKTTREKRTAFCLILYTKTTKNYGCLSLNCGTILASHSTVPKPFRQLALAVLLAPPSDPLGIYEVWGSNCFPFCPSPGSLRDQQGVGHQEVEVILARFL